MNEQEVANPSSPDDAVVADDVEVATLVAAERRIAQARRVSVDFGRALEQALTATVATLRASEPSLSEVLKESDRLAHELKSTFKVRFDAELTIVSSSDADGSRSIEQWNQAAAKLLQDLISRKIGWLRGTRERWANAFRSEISKGLNAKTQREHQSLSAAYQTYREVGVAAAAETFQEALPGLQRMLEEIDLPPIVGRLNAGAMDETVLVSGAGSLRLLVGSAEVGPLAVDLQCPGVQPNTASVASTVIPTSPLALPLLLDLDRDGGLVTDSVQTVNNMVLRTLALLPAGRVKATIYDPARLGESAKFLFGLGDNAESVIGPKVKTTERELEEALLELEEHITFVTQKYLQGTFDSLTAYDVAAGEVAEPYRLLVLYDFPKGFVRSTGADEAALARLAKIVEVGRRCGVFTFVVAGETTPRDCAAAIRRLPWLLEAKTPHPRWTALLATGDADSSALQLAVDGGGASGSAQLAAARISGTPLFTGAAHVDWRYRPDEPAAKATVDAIFAHVERGLASAGEVRVSREQVAALAGAKLARAVQRGTRADEVLAHPSRPETWWKGSSSLEISAAFGRVGASDVATLSFDSQTASGAIVGGRPGAGKSVLLHAVIAGLVTRYAPDELELYLIDFKEGVEFKSYAAGALPHARVVAVESDREFGLSVLQSLDEEITRRGSVFRGQTGEQVDLATFREHSDQTLARIVLVIDEFHVLFERDDKIAAAAAELLDRIVRQGRAFGVHAILASQTLAGTAALGRHTLNQLPIRIALQCSDADSRLLLADDNADARLLTRPGEGILNTAEGLREANLRFQAAYVPPGERAAMIATLRGMADECGLDQRPTVFEGNAAVRVEQVGLEDVQEADGRRGLSLPLGMPLTLGGPVLAELRREPAGNLLIVLEEDLALGLLSVLSVTCTRGGVAIDVLDYGALDSDWSRVLETLSAQGVRVARRREAVERLQELAALIRQRTDLAEHGAPRRLCLITALHRAREFEAGAGGEEQELLETILRDGPDVGVHVVVWCDKLASLERRLASGCQREFGLRLVGQMSRDDSFSLIDSDLAAGLRPMQAVLDDHERAQTTRVRLFTQPSEEWVSGVAEPV